MAISTPPPLYGGPGIPHSPSGSPYGGITSRGSGAGFGGGFAGGTRGSALLRLITSRFSPTRSAPFGDYVGDRPTTQPPPGNGFIVPKPSDPSQPPIIRGEPWTPPQPGLPQPPSPINNPPGLPGDALSGAGGELHPFHPTRPRDNYPGLGGFDRVDAEEPYYKRKFGFILPETPGEGFFRTPTSRLRQLSDFGLAFRGGRGFGPRRQAPAAGYSDAEMAGSIPVKKLLAARLGL